MTDALSHVDGPGVAWIDRSDRDRLDVLGPDRAKFLHNLTTNDVKRLAVGRGHEAFVTNLQGKTLGYVSLLACEDRILLRTDPGALATFLPHLQTYGIFDDVTLDNVGAGTLEFHLAGPEAEGLLRGLGASLPGEFDLAHAETALGGIAVRLVRETPTGRPGLTILAARAEADRVRCLLEDAGATVLAPAAFEALRIEAGTPVGGRDVTAENLPQELGRDAQAISFVKGCYLGQETVARIDALGHVNRLLKGVTWSGACRPAPGASLEADGKTVGKLTSVADAPGRGGGIALAFVRTSHAQEGAGVVVKDADGTTIEAVVRDLPMPSLGG